MASAYMYVSPGRALPISRPTSALSCSASGHRLGHPCRRPGDPVGRLPEVLVREGFFPDRPADTRPRSPASWRGSVAPCPKGSRWAITSATAHPRTSISSCRTTRPSWWTSLTASAASWRGRRVDFLHVPVPKDRTDAAYFQPLAGLRGFDDSTLYLGLIHHDDRDGDLARIRAAQAVTPTFGVSSECGWGRTDPERPLSSRESPRRGRASSPTPLSAGGPSAHPMTRPPMTRMLSPVT